MKLVLKIISVFFFLVGVIALLMLCGVDLGFGALLGYAAGNTVAGITLVSFLSLGLLISAVAYFLAGIAGLRGKVGLGRVSAIVILAATGITLASNALNGQFEVAQLTGLALPVLYLICLK